MIRRPPRSTLFPTRRSSDLVRGPTSTNNEYDVHCETRQEPGTDPSRGFSRSANANDQSQSEGDRKSTRLNSSHGYISYAVFCLKKKKIYELNVVMIL